MSGTSSPGVRLVVFDLGRVLIRICDDWRHACACAGVTPGPANAAAGNDAQRMARLQELSRSLEVGRIGIDAFCAGAGPLMGLSPEQARAASAAYTRHAYAGAADLVAELKSAGIATACLSNTNEHHWSLVARPDHASYFPLEMMDYRFASHLVGARKPDDVIYAHVEQMTGTTPALIVFFDDVAENVDAARRRGWHAHRIDPAPDEPVGQMRAALRGHGIRLAR